MNDCIVIYILGMLDRNLSLYMYIRYVIGHLTRGPYIMYRFYYECYFWT